ncbi:MAG: hypothetical protein ACLRPU_02575 [Enterococcus hulanensis]
MSKIKETRIMSEQQIDTIILAAYAAKQKVSIRLKSGKKVSGFICSDFDEDGFSLTSSYVWWKDIQFVQPDNKFYEEWSDILVSIPDPFDTGKADD